MVTFPSPQGLGAQSALANSQAFDNSFSRATNRPICNQSENDTAPLPSGRGETSPLRPVHGLQPFTVTVNVCVALSRGVPLSVAVTTMRLVVEACAGAGVQENSTLGSTLARVAGRPARRGESGA